MAALLLFKDINWTMVSYSIELVEHLGFVNTCTMINDR